MVCKGTWSTFDLVSLKVFKYILFHLVFRGYRGQIVMASTQLGIFFFNQTCTFSMPESQLLHTGQLATGTQWHA